MQAHPAGPIPAIEQHEVRLVEMAVKGQER